MKCSAAIGRTGIRSGEGVDPLAALEGGIGPESFVDHHAAPLSGIKPCGHCHLAAMIAEPQLVSVSDPETRSIVRVDQQFWTLFLRL